MSAVLDTHAVLWYLENASELSASARLTIEDAIRNGGDVFVSAISLVETVYLVERRRLSTSALARLQTALSDPGSGILIANVDAEVADKLQSVPRDIVPDMPDLIIAATALARGLPLITRDRRIMAAGIHTIW